MPRSGRSATPPSRRTRATPVRAVARLTAVAATALLLAACAAEASDTDAAAPDAEGATAGTGDELEPVTIGITPILPTFAIYVAEEKGFFEAEGLAVTFQEIFGNPLIAQAVQAGEVQIGTRNYDGIAAAVSEGADLQLLYPTVIYDEAKADAFIMMRTDIADEGVAGLAGQSFAVGSGSQQEAAVKTFLEGEGVDPSSVQFTEVSYADMAAAFESGALGGAHVVEPFITQLVDAGLAEPVGTHLGLIADRYLINVSFASGAWIDDHPEEVAAFAAAMEQSVTYILENIESEEILDLATQWTGTEPELLTRFFPSRYEIATEITLEELTAPLEFALETGTMRSEVAVEDLVSDVFPLTD